MTTKLKPTEVICLFKILATIDWRELSATDRYGFADAGPDARIAELNDAQHGTIAELFDFRAPADMGMMAILGGDETQLELHSTDENGSPIWILINLAFDITE